MYTVKSFDIRSQVIVLLHLFGEKARIFVAKLSLLSKYDSYFQLRYYWQKCAQRKLCKIICLFQLTFHVKMMLDDVLCED